MESAGLRQSLWGTVKYWPECSKKLSPRLCNFPGCNSRFGEGECEFRKSIIGHLGFYLEGVIPKVCKLFIRKLFNCRYIITKLRGRRHVESRALSPHLDSKISIHRHICNFVHIEVIGITGKGAVVWGLEWIVEKGRRGPITALGRRDNGAAKG